MMLPDTSEEEDDPDFTSFPDESDEDSPDL